MILHPLLPIIGVSIIVNPGHDKFNIKYCHHVLHQPVELGPGLTPGHEHQEEQGAERDQHGGQGGASSDNHHTLTRAGARSRLYTQEPRLEPERDQVRVNISNVSMFIISAPEIQPILSILFIYKTYRITKFSV